MSLRKKKRRVFEIEGNLVKPGERKRFSIGATSLFDFTELGIPVEVIRGNEPGPVLFISGAIHGDEINGVEIIRKLLRRKELSQIKGTIIAIPIINVFGFNNKSRYLPDGRDLNRSFPGSKEGSQAGRMAYMLMNEVVKKSTHGIDFHTGALHRTNLPQIRAFMEDEKTRSMAKAFDAPLILNSSLRDGSLREAARKRKIPMLLFEGGEALRFDENVIKIGVRGCINVMRSIGMLPPALKKRDKEAYIAQSSHWVRAPHGGCLRLKKKLGEAVSKGDILGVISDPFDRERIEVLSRSNGVVIGLSLIPLVNRGDAIIHIGAPDKNTDKDGIDYLD